MPDAFHAGGACTARVSSTSSVAGTVVSRGLMRPLLVADHHGDGIGNGEVRGRAVVGGGAAPQDHGAVGDLEDAGQIVRDDEHAEAAAPRNMLSTTERSGARARS